MMLLRKYQPNTTIPELISDIEQFAAQNDTFDQVDAALKAA